MAGRTPAIGLVVLAAVASSVMATAAAHAQQLPQGSVAAPPTVKKSVWGQTALNGQSLFPTYQDLGVGLYSIQARWDHIAPEDRPRDPRTRTTPPTNGRRTSTRRSPGRPATA